MRLKLLLCLAMLGTTAPALAEDWKQVPGDETAYFDNDFLKVDQQSGLVVMRYAIGRAKGATYKDWPAGKSPIMVYALDCISDAYKDLGLDFEGKGTLAADWRSEPDQTGIELGVGGAGKAACERRETLPKVALP